MSDAFDLTSRICKLEAEVRQVHEEVEACSLLILSADVSSKSIASKRNGEHVAHKQSPVQSPLFGLEEIDRLLSRVSVLEESWSIRSAVIPQDVEQGIVRLEREVMELWGNVRKQEDAHTIPVRELSNRVEVRLDEFREQLLKVHAEVKAFTGHDHLMQMLTTSIASKVRDSTGALEQRCSNLEQDTAVLQGHMETLKTDHQHIFDLQCGVEDLLQLNRESTVNINLQMREIEAQFNQIHETEHREGSWRAEARLLHKELEDLRASKLPAVFEQCSRSSKIIAEGLQTLRKEMLELSEQVHMISSKGVTSKETELIGEIASIRTEIHDQRQQMSQIISGALEECLINLRADLAAEVESTMSESREAWGDVARKVAALERWPTEQVALHAEVRALMFARKDDFTRIKLMVNDEIQFARAESDCPGHTENQWISPNQSKSAEFGQVEYGEKVLHTDRPLHQRDVRADCNDDSSSGTRPLTRSELPVVKITGNKVAWALPSSTLTSISSSDGSLVTEVFSIASIPCQLKFFPHGSYLHRKAGFCSLYLQASPLVAPTVIRFRFFAGTYVSPVLECTYVEKRDHGRHDLCSLQDVFESGGDIVIGAELLDVHPCVEDNIGFAHIVHQSSFSLFQ